MSKERLEEIKTRFNAMKELESFKKLAPTDLFFDDYDWLIQQAERVQELESENRILRTVAESNKYIGEQYLEQNKRYREAIEKIKNKVSQQLEGLDAEEEMERVIKLSELMSISIEALEREE